MRIISANCWCYEQPNHITLQYTFVLPVPSAFFWRGSASLFCTTRRRSTASILVWSDLNDSELRALIVDSKVGFEWLKYEIWTLEWRVHEEATRTQLISYQTCTGADIRHSHQKGRNGQKQSRTRASRHTPGRTRLYSTVTVHAREMTYSFSRLWPHRDLISSNLDASEEATDRSVPFVQKLHHSPRFSARSTHRQGNYN